MPNIITCRVITLWGLITTLLFVPLQLLAEEQQKASPALVNQLAEHPSPYLALHGNDPVAWQDWGPEVIERARRENRPILISSGYFSCHWCHVMQRESYQNPAIADMLNEYFIPVKIDRELEPALDKRLMAYAQGTLGRGGWPLNVFMSPDGLPVYAVLYQPPAPFLGLLTRLSGVWKQQSERIRELALTEKPLRQFPDSPPELDISWANGLILEAVETILASGDDIQGGFGQINKFPSTPQLDFLLDALDREENPELAEFLKLTLSAMSENGMRDHLGGGFFRYVVDPAWEIPHFEKMLYDNANLARIYLKAGKVLNSAVYIEIARDTLDFMIDQMSSEHGALYASFSAIDDKDVEGGYYIWNDDQLKQLLNDQEYRVFTTLWQTRSRRDFDEGNHLRDAQTINSVANSLEIDPVDISSLRDSAYRKLLDARSQRILPTDDKLLAGWNALALSAYAIAARQLDDETYRNHAQKIKTFLLEKLWQDDQLSRSLAKEKLLGNAAIEDYAYLSEGLLNWAHLSANDQDYKDVEMVLAQAWSRFHHHNAWSFADISLLPPEDGEEILSEDSSASPSAVLIKTTLSLHELEKLSDNGLYLRALSALNRGDEQLRKSPFWYASQLSAMLQLN